MTTEKIELFNLPEKLLEVNGKINVFIQHCDSRWHQLHKKLAEWMAAFDFPNFIDSCPNVTPYYRLPVHREAMPVCLTLFVFRQITQPGSVVLMHTYAGLNPNGRVYSPKKIMQSKQECRDSFIECRTPIHSHQVKCHSYVAWVEGAVTVHEQVYVRSGSGVKLVEELARPAGSTTFDESCGSAIHSLSVRFYRFS